ncbi:MAG: hypothetical protein LBP81_09385 [Treponema sp.]|jgi:hypothetical protein|nr:hypothetical protein [Treponema sp.]
MSFKELQYLVIQLVTSWQVIGVTAVVFFYFFLISSVSRGRYKLKVQAATSREKKKKVPRKATPTAAEENLVSDGDDLGIEEEK